MNGQIAAQAKRIATEPAITVLVLMAGGRAFSAGSDVNALDGLGTPWDGHTRVDYDRDYFAPLLRLGKPAIDSYCLGRGLKVAMCADIRIATPHSTFGAPGVRRGWHAGSGNTSILPRLIGYGNAALWLLTGGRFPSEEAYRVGLVPRGLWNPVPRRPRHRKSRHRKSRHRKSRHGRPRTHGYATRLPRELWGELSGS